MPPQSRITAFRSIAALAISVVSVPVFIFFALSLSYLPYRPAQAEGQADKGASAGASKSTSYDSAALQAYYKEIWARISKKWWVPEELMFKQVAVNMTLDKEGALTAVSLSKSSGDKRADTLALIGIKRAAPFGPPPEGLPLPFKTVYTIGFAAPRNGEVMFYDGKRYDKGEAVTLATGTKLANKDRPTSDLDKQFHIKKEAALIKMDQLEDELAAGQKTGEAPIKRSKQLVEYAACLTAIQEQAEAGVKLTEALDILEKNKAADSDIFPCLSQLAQLKYTTGDLAGAEPLFKRAVEIQEKSQSAAPVGQSSQYKSLLETYAKLLYKQNRAQEADELYKKIKTMG